MMRMKVLIRFHEVWNTIEPGLDDQKKNDVATALLFHFVSETLILLVENKPPQKKSGTLSSHDTLELIM